MSTLPNPVVSNLNQDFLNDSALGCAVVFCKFTYTKALQSQNSPYGNTKASAL